MSRPLVGAVTSGVVTSAVAVAYYVNQWGPQTSPDTPSYLSFTLVDAIRLPGYPLFLNLFGDSIAVASVAQAVLFVAAAVEVYAIAWLLTRRAAIATMAALAVGTNTYLLSYVKPAIVEGLAIWLVTTLALAVVLYLRHPCPRLLWMTAGVLLLAILTRPEWAYAPIPLFLYLARRHLRWHAAGAVVAIYLVVGAYVGANAALNGYPGLTVVERINLFGKVLQYRMHEDAPARYASLTRKVELHLRARGDRGPYTFVEKHPEAGANDYALASEYAKAAILSSPTEYVAKTAAVAVKPPDVYPFSPISRERPFAGALLSAQRAAASTLATLSVFPPLALAWLLLRVRDRRLVVDGMAALGLLGIYETAVIAAGGYGDYVRLLAPITPVRLILVISSAGLIAVAIARRVRRLGAARACYALTEEPDGELAPAAVAYEVDGALQDLRGARARASGHGRASTG